MRLFIGIKTGCEDYLAELQRRLSELGRGRLTERDNLHITLKFLGEVPPHRVKEICGAMAGVSGRPMSLKCLGVHVFNSKGIISCGVGGDTAALRALAAKLEAALETIGFPKENRPFRAHITLARDFRPNPGADVESIPFCGKAFSVKEMILFESAHVGGRLAYLPLYTQQLR